MDVEIVEGRDPPIVRVGQVDTSADERRLEQLAESLVAQGYPAWVRDCARAYPDAGTLVFELACGHEGTVSAVRSKSAQGAYVECTRCACRLYDDDRELWLSPPRNGW